MYDSFKKGVMVKKVEGTQYMKAILKMLNLGLPFKVHIKHANPRAPLRHPLLIL